MPTAILIPSDTDSEQGWSSSNIHSVLDDQTNTATQNNINCDWTGDMTDLDGSLSGETINSVKLTLKAQRGAKGNATVDVKLIDGPSGNTVINQTLTYDDASSEQTLETSAATTQHDGSTALTFSYLNACKLAIDPDGTGITVNQLFATVDYGAAVVIAPNIVTLSSGNITINNGTITL